MRRSSPPAWWSGRAACPFRSEFLEGLLSRGGAASSLMQTPPECYSQGQLSSIATIQVSARIAEPGGPHGHF